MVSSVSSGLISCGPQASCLVIFCRDFHLIRGAVNKNGGVGEEMGENGRQTVRKESMEIREEGRKKD